MVFSKEDTRETAEAAVAFVAVGWVANSAGLNLARAGVETDARGYVRVDAYSSDICAAHLRGGRHHRPPDVVPQAIQDGFVAPLTPCAARRRACGPGQSYRQLHRSGICPGRPDRSEGPRNPRCGCRGGALRRDHPHDHRRPDGRVLQADRRPRDGRDPRLPRCWRAGGRDRPGGGDRDSRGMRVDDLARVPPSFPTMPDPRARGYRAAGQPICRSRHGCAPLIILSPFRLCSQRQILAAPSCSRKLTFRRDNDAREPGS